MRAFLPVIKIVPTQLNVAAAWAQQPSSFLPSFLICETHTEVQLHQMHSAPHFQQNAGNRLIPFLWQVCCHRIILLVSISWAQIDNGASTK